MIQALCVNHDVFCHIVDAAVDEDGHVQSRLNVTVEFNLVAKSDTMEELDAAVGKMQQEADRTVQILQSMFEIWIKRGLDADAFEAGLQADLTAEEKPHSGAPTEEP